MPVEIAEFFGSMINMDAPRHTRLRLIVNRAFTPRQVARIDEQVQAKAEAIVDRGGRHGRVRLRLRDRRHAPARDHLRHDGHPAVASTSGCSSSPTSSSGAGDAEYTPDFLALMNAAVELSQMAQEIGRDRLGQPDRRPHHGADARRGRGRGRRGPPPHRRGARLVLHPAGGGRQRDHPQRHQPRHVRADHPSRSAGAAGRGLRGRASPARSRRSCGGPRRSSTSAAPPPRTA